MTENTAPAANEPEVEDIDKLNEEADDTIAESVDEDDDDSIDDEDEDDEE